MSEKVEDGKAWRWTIEPHPYDHDFDAMVTDDDKEALDAILEVAEMYLWDQNEGGSRMVTVTLNQQVRCRG